jgi:hypothetical protein
MIANLAGIGHHAFDKCCGFGWRNRSGQGPSKQEDQDMSKARKTKKEKEESKTKWTIIGGRPSPAGIESLARLCVSIARKRLAEQAASESAGPRKPDKLPSGVSFGDGLGPTWQFLPLRSMKGTL